MSAFGGEPKPPFYNSFEYYLEGEMETGYPCPQCGKPMKRVDNRWVCDNCGYEEVVD